MPNMPAFRHAVERIAGENPGLGIGVHLCLTSGRPFSDPAQVPLLVDGRGEFCHGFFGLWRLLRSSQRGAALGQIRRELNAQAERVASSSLVIDHVNGHQHVHLIPGVFAYAAEIARRFGAAIRIPRAEKLAARLPLRHRLERLFYGGTAKAVLLDRLSRRAEREEKIAAAEHCLGVAESGRLTSAVLHQIVRRLPDGVSELLCHPGAGTAADEAVVCSREDRQFLACNGRKAELAAVLDPAIREALEQTGVELIRFRDWERSAPSVERAA
jgi:predicted glycoside hydrolase/deacetylase ChbG (UPF0249 family)